MCGVVPRSFLLICCPTLFCCAITFCVMVAYVSMGLVWSYRCPLTLYMAPLPLGRGCLQIRVEGWEHVKMIGLTGEIDFSIHGIYCGFQSVIGCGYLPFWNIVFLVDSFYNNDVVKKSLEFTYVGFLVFGVSWYGADFCYSVFGIFLAFNNEIRCSTLLFKLSITNYYCCPLLDFHINVYLWY